jgi:ribosome recycling factor
MIRRCLSKRPTAAFSFDLGGVQKALQQQVDRLHKDYSQLRVGHATPSLLEGVRVRLESQTMPLSKLAQVSVLDASTLGVHVYDTTTTSLVENAIRSANLNLNPITTGHVIKIPIPKMTKEIRQDTAKQVSTLLEVARNGIRHERTEAMKKLKKAALKHVIAEDDATALESKVQKLVDEVMKQAEVMSKNKAKEVLNG